jgi:hypothetical protein
MEQNTTDDKFFKIQFQYCYQFVVNCDELANRADVTDHQFRETMKRELRRCLMDCEKRKNDNTINK